MSSHRARWLDGFLDHLDVTPEQGKVIRREAGEIVDQLRDLKGEMRGARSDIARALRGDSFDETVMGESFARQDESIRRAREQLVAGLARVHDALEPHQRERFADLLDRGLRGSFRPYRDPA
ncbi:MAG: periplasmic heavy metal sensor [Myxococcales bacterium FL481]|nr:MAG: periplasmic heavy metal sensor [Myxococcales bacterium FL481]